MKSLRFALLCLLCTVAWADDEDSQSVEDADPLAIALPIFINEDDETYGLAVFDKVNWYQAELICRSAGYTLLDISTDLVQNQIKSLLLSSDLDLSEHSRSPFWLSGTNQGSNSQYVWQSTGQRITYNEFLINPPTNSQRCIGYNVATNYWSNHDCRDERYFICKALDPAECPS